VKTTIVMLSVDEAHLLEHSLPAAVGQPRADVVVVDNACEDATASVVERCGARRIGLAQRRSYCAAINAGIANSDGDAVLLLNADCVLDAGFLDAAVASLQRAGVGSVAPKLIRAAGVTPDARLDVLDTVGMSIDRRRKNGLVGHNAPAQRYRRRAEVFGGDGAAVLYRRETLDACAVGGEVLDEDFELWAADADLAWRAQLLGWRCVYEPRAVAWHVRYYSPSTRATLDVRHRRLQFRNRYLMLLKNETPRALARDLHRIAAYEALALGHVLLRERELLRGYRDAIALAPAARRRRAAIQARRAGGRVPFGLTAPQ
jgi:GT2 family glycosyltransferase